LVRAHESEQKRVIGDMMRKAKIAAKAAERARRAYEEAERLRCEADVAMLRAAESQDAKARGAREAADKARDAVRKAEWVRNNAARKKQLVSKDRDQRVRRAELEVDETYRAALSADNANRRILAAQAGKDVSGKEPDELRGGAWVEAHGLLNNKSLNGVKGQLIRRRGDDVVVSFMNSKTIKVIHVSNVRPCLRPMNTTEESAIQAAASR